MSRITKELASSIAEQLLKPKKEAITALKKERKDIVSDLYFNELPVEIRKAFEKYPAYFSRQSSVRIHGPGFGYECYELSKSLPQIDHSLSVDEKTGNVIKKLSNKIEKLQQEYRVMESEIENALLALRTYKNVEKEFPEAASYLPEKHTTALIVNISSIREKLTA